jgi:hypothetical protein
MMGWSCLFGKAASIKNTELHQQPWGTKNGPNSPSPGGFIKCIGDLTVSNGRLDLSLARCFLVTCGAPYSSAKIGADCKA